MRYLKSRCLSVSFFLLVSCTNKTAPEFNWKGLTNKAIAGVEIEAGQLGAAGAEVASGHWGVGASIRVVEHLEGVETFDKHFQKMEILLNSVYQKYAVPYPGQVTKSISCPPEFMPKPLPLKDNSAIKSRGFLLKANDRQVFGACTTENAHFQAAYLLTGCKARNAAYEIKIFLPAADNGAEELARIYEHFSCE